MVARPVYQEDHEYREDARVVPCKRFKGFLKRYEALLVEYEQCDSDLDSDSDSDSDRDEDESEESSGDDTKDNS